MIVKFIKYNEHINEGVFGSYKDKKPNSPNSNIESGKKLAKTVILKVVFDTIKSFVSDKLCQYCDEVHAEAKTYNKYKNKWGSSDKEKFCQIPVIGNSNTKHVENIIVESETDDTIKITIPLIPVGLAGSAIFMLYFLDDVAIPVYCKNRLLEDLAKYTGECEDIIRSYNYDIKFYFDKMQYASSTTRYKVPFSLLKVNTQFESNAGTNIYIDKLKDFVDLLDNQKLEVNVIKVEIKGDNSTIHFEKLLSLVQYNKIELIFAFKNKCDNNSIYNHISNCINAIQDGKKVVVVTSGRYEEKISGIVYDFIFRTYLSTTLKDIFIDLNNKNKDANYNAIDEIKFVMGHPIKNSTVKISAYTV